MTRELTRELHRVHPGLMWQLGPAEVDGRRELTISADGDLSVFDEVEALADAAPSLPRWRVQRFRPPEATFQELRLRLGPVELSAGDIEFTVRKLPDGLVYVTLFVRGLRETGDEARAHAAYMFVELALGEYDTGCLIADIEALPAEDPGGGESRYPFSEFANLFPR